MSVRSQSGLAEAFLHPSVGRNARLEAIGDRIDWSAVAAVLGRLRRGRMGPPSYPPLLMFKALLLQQWYGLSDPGLEQALGDRMSFRRFVGLMGDQAAPDHATLWRFREALAKAGLEQAAFEAVAAQLDAKGLILRQGPLIDASLIEASWRSPLEPSSRPRPDAEAPTHRPAATPKPTPKRRHPPKQPASELTQSPRKRGRPKSRLPLHGFGEEVAASAVFDLDHPEVGVDLARALGVGVQLGLGGRGEGLHPQPLAVGADGLGVQPAGAVAAVDRLDQHRAGARVALARDGREGAAELGAADQGGDPDVGGQQHAARNPPASGAR